MSNHSALKEEDTKKLGEPEEPFGRWMSMAGTKLAIHRR